MSDQAPTSSSGQSIKETKCVNKIKTYRMENLGVKSWRERSDKVTGNILNNELDENDDDTVEVEMLDNSRYKTSLHVAQHYLGLIIGKNGSTRSEIEKETETYIKIPRQGQDGDIIILGQTAVNVKAARRIMNKIVISSRMKKRSTHFISIPMNHPDIVKRFEEFKTTVLRECAGSRGLDETLFKSPAKLHLTVGVMCLMDNEEKIFASQLLNEAKTKVIAPLLEGHLPLKIRLKRLSFMNDDPTNIHVLYGTVEEEGDCKGLIQQLADGLMEHFLKAGYMKREYDKVTLHVTFMNSNKRKCLETTNAAEPGLSKYSRKPRESFDGTEILNKYSDYDFGLMELKDIHLSELSMTGTDGYYQPACIIDITS